MLTARALHALLDEPAEQVARDKNKRDATGRANHSSGHETGSRLIRNAALRTPQAHPNHKPPDGAARPHATPDTLRRAARRTAHQQDEGTRDDTSSRNEEHQSSSESGYSRSGSAGSSSEG